MNAFEKIKERLEEETLGKPTPHEFDRGINRAIRIVSEVEAEYTKNIMDELLEAKKNCGEDSDCSQCVFGCEDGCRLQELQITGGNNGWIPCSERLPEKCGAYLVSYKNTNCIPCATVFDGVQFLDKHVIAWMPLPEAYKPET